MIFVADLHAFPHAIDELRQTLAGIARVTANEPGAIAYSVRQHMDDPTRFQVSEHYRDRAAWEAHMSTPYVQHALSQFDLWLQSPPELSSYTELAHLSGAD